MNVSGNFLIKNASAKVSIRDLRVGGSFTVTAAAYLKLGSAYVVGSTGLTGTSTSTANWDIGTLVTTGGLTVGGAQSMGSAASPVTMLMTGSAKAMTYGSTGRFYGLLCNPYGTFTQTAGSIVGSVLCGTTGTLKNGSTITYDPSVGSESLASLPHDDRFRRRRSAAGEGLVQHQPGPGLNVAVGNGWATVTGITYKINGAPHVISGWTGSFIVPFGPVLLDGLYTVVYSATDNSGNPRPTRPSPSRSTHTTPRPPFSLGPTSGPSTARRASPSVAATIWRPPPS